MRPRKLRQRPSDELIDIRESVYYGKDRGLPWLFSVFVVLFLLLTILLFYFIFTTRDVYLSQKQAIEEEDVKMKESAAQIKEESDEDEMWDQNQQKRRKGKGKLDNQEKLHVDIVPIVHRKTGEPDKPPIITVTNATLRSMSTVQNGTTSTTENPLTTVITDRLDEVTSNTRTTASTTTTTTSTTTTSTITTTAEVETTTETPSETTTAEPMVEVSTKPIFTTTTTTTTTEATTTTSPTSTTTQTPSPEIAESDEDVSAEEQFPTINMASQESDESEDLFLELEDNIDNVQVEEYEETTATPLPTSVAPPSTTTTSIPEIVTTEASTVNVKIRDHTRIIWDRRQLRSKSEKYSKFAIVSHHEECSSIGKKIHDAGGNSIDATIASEFCTSAVHPHTTGPGFGAVILVHSKKKNGTFVIDGRERSPRNANQNTFVINPTIAHIGYSSMGVPGWISAVWTAYKQFGSGKVTWKQLIEPTIEMLETKRIRVDRLLGHAFESRKNHILHEKSFATWLNETTREGVQLRNPEYEHFLKQLKESAHAEHDFYGGNLAKTIVDEMKSRGGLISKQDLETYSVVVTRAESVKVGSHFLTGPHLPYHFPILRKAFQNITETFETNPESFLEYYLNFVELLQKANQMKKFVADDLFDPEVKPKVDQWIIPDNFKSEEQIEQDQQKRKQISFSRIMSVDEEGNSVNFMSTNSVPWGSVRRSSTMGFVWNNAMSSFDVFCRHDLNCVRGGKRPSVVNGFPTILLDAENKPQLLISPTSNQLETTAAITIQSTLMNMLPLVSMDHPRIYPQSTDQVFVETGIPEVLYRRLWSDFRAQFTHPTSPITLLHRNPDDSTVEALCDFRQNVKICYPSGT